MNTSRETDYVNGSEEHFTVSDIRKPKGLNQEWIILRQRQRWVQYEERMANTRAIVRFMAIHQYLYLDGVNT
jgi:hypothetical protein